jgi:RimJ/RimL family protein N-acetyltransferase
VTGDITLHDVTDADVRVFFEQQLDPEAVEMSGFPARDWDAFVAHWATIRADESVVTKTIEAAGRVAGNVVSWATDGQRDVGYWLGKEFWGQGIATKALTEFLSIETTRPTYAHVATHNVGSIRVLEKCGFTVMEEAQVDGVDEYLMKLSG